ncbi:MAG: hypothetical protein IH830_00790 [Planctomycetes bacterium]|nr:hypothetical protein [Planctomycetota bacterium]
MMDESQIGPDPSYAGARRRPWPSAVYVTLLIIWGLASRLPYVTDFESMGKDGPEYINSLALDETYNVPPPGNIGFVVLAKAAQVLWPTPVYAYAAVTIAISCLALVFVYLLGTRFMPRPLAAVAALAFSCDTIVWFHGTPIKSYPVWMVALPAIAYFGTRFAQHKRTGDLIAASLALGLCSVVRNDLVAFGGPLWAGCLLLGRARLRDWLLGAAVVGVCVSVWFFSTASLLGGPRAYLQIVRAKHELHEQLGVEGRGLIDGLLRNLVKYGIWLIWSAHLALIPFAYCLWRYVRSFRHHWRGLTLAALWMLPSCYFAFIISTFASAQIFQFTPLVYLGALRGLQLWARPGNKILPVAGGLLIALVCALQFTVTPLLPNSNQRNVIINVNFIKYTGAGIHNDYNYNLVDFGMSSSLKSVVKQLRRPEPVPKIPPRRLQGKNEPLRRPGE